MKKIFAFVLASLMVLSLVPASAFAAVTKCPATHTSTNCDATLLYTAVADCENVGYQAYVCNDCGAQFMDNMKPKTEHKWVSDTDNASKNIAASCVYKTDGIQWLVCANCESGYIVDGVEVGYKTISYNSVDVHDLKLSSGVGCEKLYECTLCDAKGYIDAENGLLVDEVAHTWEFVEVDALPKLSGGKSTPGQAVYACKDCVATKKVDILIRVDECTHPSHTDKEEAVKVCGSAPSCTADGYLMVVKCPDCNMHWACKTYEKESVASKITNANCLANHKEMNDHDWEVISDTDDDGDFKDEKLADDTAIKISKWGHVIPANSTASDCGDPYVCARCKTSQKKDHVYTDIPNTSVAATCGKKAYKFQQCTCGNVKKTEYGSKLNHTKTPVYIPATCSSPAMSFNVCTRGNKCSITPTVINGTAYRINGSITTSGNVNPNNHNFDPAFDGTEITVGTLDSNLYCGDAKITYTYKYCLNEGCPVYGSGNPEVNYPTLHDKYVTSYTHNFTYAHGGYGALSSYVYYACKNCTWKSKGITEPDTNLSVNSFDTLEEALVYYGFLKRTSVYNPSTGKITNTYSPRTMFAEAGFTTTALLKSAVASALPNGIAASCTTAGSTTWVISYTFGTTPWATYVSIVDPKLPHTPGKTTTGKLPTCNTSGIYDTSVCVVCGVTYWELDGEQYTTSPVRLPCANLYDEVSNPNGTLFYREGSCGDENGYYECTLCGTCYTDAACTTKYVPVEHDYVYLLEGVAATCNTTGVPEIRYCADCAALEVNVIYLNGGKEVRINFNTSNFKYKSSSETVVNFMLGDINLLSAPVEATVKVDGTVSYKYVTTSDKADTEEDETVYETWNAWPAVVTVNKMETAGHHQGLYKNVTDGETTTKVLATGKVSPSEVFFADSERPVDTDFEELDHTKPSFTLVHCEACVYEYIRDFTAAQGGHVNAKGKLITENCADGAGEDRVCVTCYKYYYNLAEGATEEEKKANTKAKYEDKYTFGAHTLVNAAAQTGFDSKFNDEFDTVYTCQTSGYKAELCTTCNLYVVDSDSYEAADAKKFHDNLKAAIKANDYSAKYLCQRGPVADYAQNGNSYYACYVCEAQLTTPKATPCPGTGLEINMSTEYDEYMPNSYIELVISLDSLKGVNAWGLNFSVGYNPEVVKFIDADFTASPFATNVANDVEGSTYTQNDKGMWVPSTAKVPYGVVSVASSSTSGVELKGNNEYAVLVFQVIEAGQYPEFSIGYIQPWQMNGNNSMSHPLANTWYKANAVGANGKAIKVNYNVTADFIGDYIVANSVQNKTIEVETLTFLDLDESGELDIFDAFELYYLIETDVYSVLADADHDGDVDTDDLDLLYAVLVGEKTLKDILKDEEVEEEERVIKYDEEGFVVYDSLYDINDDGVLSAYEIAVMTGKIDADLNPGT